MAGSSSGELRAPIFNGENYEFWSIRMKTIFKSHGLWEFVEKGVEISDSKGAAGSDEKKKDKEDSSDAVKISFTEALMKDAKALGLIQGAVSEEIFPRIAHEETSKGAWNLLMREFHGDKQVRSSPSAGQDFGPMDEVTCGGNALRFYAAVRLRIKRTRLLKTEDKVTGLGISVQVVKNKLAPAMKKADLGIQFGRGLCRESEVFQLACEHGLIAKEGSSYLIGRKVFSTEHAAEQYLAKNDALFDKAVMILRKMMFER